MPDPTGRADDRNSTAPARESPVPSTEEAIDWGDGTVWFISWFDDHDAFYAERWYDPDEFDADDAAFIAALHDKVLTFEVAQIPQTIAEWYRKRRPEIAKAVHARWLLLMPRQPPAPRQQPEPSRAQNELPTAQAVSPALHRRSLPGRHDPIGARGCQGSTLTSRLWLPLNGPRRGEISLPPLSELWVRPRRIGLSSAPRFWAWWCP